MFTPMVLIMIDHYTYEKYNTYNSQCFLIIMVVNITLRYSVAFRTVSSSRLLLNAMLSVERLQRSPMHSPPPVVAHSLHSRIRRCLTPFDGITDGCSCLTLTLHRVNTCVTYRLIGDRAIVA
jgi:hypothetical protein